MLMVSVRKDSHPHQKHQVNASDVGKEEISKQNAIVWIEPLPVPLLGKPHEDLDNTSESKIQIPKVDPGAKITKSKKEVTVNDLKKKINETKSEVQSLRENLAILKVNHNQRLKHLEHAFHQGNGEGTSF